MAKKKKQAKKRARKVDLSSVVGKGGEIIPKTQTEAKAIEPETLIPRIATGIRGLDELVEGGFPENALILLAGSTGTGKSTFAMNFLVEGALRGEPGVYISMEVDEESSKRQMQLFGWPIDDLINKRVLSITQPELYDFEKLMTNIEDSVARMGAKRLVIDSISLISMYFKDEFKVRRSLLDLEEAIKNLSCTTLAISEIKEDVPGISMYGVEEYVVDGVIVLYFIKRENVFSRAIAIRKMRSTAHSLKIHPVQIKRPGGIIVYPSEEVFTEL